MNIYLKHAAEYFSHRTEYPEYFQIFYKSKNVIFTASSESQINKKILSKKLLLGMSVAQLKAMCSKLFKVEVINQKLVYVEEGYEGEYVFDEDHRQLSFFSIKDGGKIIVREI